MVAGLKSRHAGLMLLLGVAIGCSGSDGGSRESDASTLSADGSAPSNVDAGHEDSGSSVTAAPQVDAAVDATVPPTAVRDSGVVPAPLASDAAVPMGTPDASTRAPLPDASSVAPTEPDAAPSMPVDTLDDAPPVSGHEPDAAVTTAPPPETIPDAAVAPDACPPEGCAPPAEVCEGCSISGVCRRDGELNPNNTCEYCDRLASPSAWSARAAGARCDDGLFCNGADSCAAGTCSRHAGRVCSDGIACNGTETCVERLDSCQPSSPLCGEGQLCDAESGACSNVCDGCQIDGVCFANGATAPLDPCLSCDVGQNPNGWSSREGQVCSESGAICQDDVCACAPGFIGESCDVCVVYVSLDGNDENTGTSWDQSLQSVQAGLDLAATRVERDDLEECEVWVKEGTYHPLSVDQEDVRAASIQLRSRVALYGGFAGDETQLSGRDWQTHVTTLSGELDDGEDNSYHVVRGADQATIDGFDITGGVASGSDGTAQLGGGIYLDHTSPTIRHCDVFGNFATQGGGLYADTSHAVISESTFASNEAFERRTEEQIGGTGAGAFTTGGGVTFENVKFDQNSAGQAAGGLGADDAPVLRDCTFSNNEANQSEQSLGGGAVLVGEAEISDCKFFGNTASRGGALVTGRSAAAVTNSVFYDNSADHGGAVYAAPVGEGAGPYFEHCTFFANQANIEEAGGALAIASVARENGDAINEIAAVELPNLQLGVGLIVRDSIIWGNSFPPIADPSGVSFVTYTLIAGGWPGEGNFDCDPLFVDESAFDLHLKPASPAIDMSDPDGMPDGFDLDGDNDVAEQLPWDIEHQARAVDGDATPPAIADLGAYEATSSEAPELLTGQINSIESDLSAAFCADGQGEYFVSYSHSGSDNDTVEVKSEVVAPSSVVTGLIAHSSTTGTEGEAAVETGHVSGFADQLEGREITTRVTLNHCGRVLDQRHVVNSCDVSGTKLVDTIVGGSQPLDVSTGQWQWLDEQDMLCADGSTTGFAVNLVPDSKEMVIFLDGGGACNSAASCRLLQIATSFDEEDFAARIALLSNAGIFQRGDDDNPLAKLSWAYVPYCTGDVHSGNHFADGRGDLNFVGHRNLGVVVDTLRRAYGTLDHLIVAGGSAGGFGTLFNFDQAAGYFGEAKAQLLDDSGPLLGQDWMTDAFQATTFDVWQTSGSVPALCPSVADGNLTALYGCLAGLYPSSRFGVVTTTRDQVNRAFLGLDATAYATGVADLETQLATQTQWAMFVQDSESHALSLNNPLSSVRVPDDESGTTLSSFMRSVINDELPASVFP